MNGARAAQLRNVTTPWYGLHIRTAGGHLVVPIGMCPAWIQIRGANLDGYSFVLREYFKQLIVVVLDFFQKYMPVKTLRVLVITLFIPRPLDEECNHTRPAFRICEENVTLRPKPACSLTFNACDPRLIVAPRSKTSSYYLLANSAPRTKTLLTNFIAEHHHL